MVCRPFCPKPRPYDIIVFTCYWLSTKCFCWKSSWKHRGFDFYHPKGRGWKRLLLITMSGPWGKQETKEKKKQCHASPYHQRFHRCHHHGHTHPPGHLCHDLPDQSWAGWDNYPIREPKQNWYEEGIPTTKHWGNDGVSISVFFSVSLCLPSCSGM